jgi:hypothetical protein
MRLSADNTLEHDGTNNFVQGKMHSCAQNAWLMIKLLVQHAQVVQSRADISSDPQSTMGMIAATDLKTTFSRRRIQLSNPKKTVTRPQRISSQPLPPRQGSTAGLSSRGLAYNRHTHATTPLVLTMLFSVTGSTC